MKTAHRAVSFAIDRGGTFTDVYAQIPDGDNGGCKIRTLKLLSQSSEYSDSCLEAIRRILSEDRQLDVVVGKKIDTSHIESIRMGTTIATNALLERKGERIGLAITRGFADLMEIGDQTRSSIFNLHVKRCKSLCEAVVEIHERVQLTECEGSSPQQAPCQQELADSIQCSSAQRVRVLQSVNEAQVRECLTSLYEKGIKTLAIVLLHSCAFKSGLSVLCYDDPCSLNSIWFLQATRASTTTSGTYLRAMGFDHVYLSHESSSVNKLLSRACTVCTDAYLTPTIQSYIGNFITGFTDRPNVAFMQSDGGLAAASEFSGVRGILSGPAGGYVGVAKTAFGIVGKPVIGFDMGGTSTDVCRYDGEYDVVYETSVSGVSLHIPQLNIRTVAAGGGSILTSRNGMLYVGPESSGAAPGPACYGNNGPLSLTDANVVLGRLPSILFPRVFGKDHSSPIDENASIAKMKEMGILFNTSDGKINYPELTVEHLALGFIRIANEAMTRPILNITRVRLMLELPSAPLSTVLCMVQGQGYDSRGHILASFGGAGGLHACAMACQLNIDTVFIHKLAGILSAYGLALADVHSERSETTSQVLRPHGSTDDGDSEDTILKSLYVRIETLERIVEKNLKKNGFSSSQIAFSRFMRIRYESSTHLLRIPVTHDDICGSSDYLHTAFRSEHQRSLGFVLDSPLIVEEIRVLGIGKSFVQAALPQKADELATCTPVNTRSIWYDVGTDEGGLLPVQLETKVFRSEDLRADMRIAGPALICDPFTTILIEPYWNAAVLKDKSILLKYDRGNSDDGSSDSTCPPPIQTQANTSSNHKLLPNENLESDKECSTIATSPNPITLTVMAHRLMGIAEQMGHVLQRIASSVNIKERLDYSCAVFDATGALIANAPHVPVHLGSMQDAVRAQIDIRAGDWNCDDVILCNHPGFGGSHLPDLTVITPVLGSNANEVAFYVASRGHHADIGGAVPGSMPSSSVKLADEGALIKSFTLVRCGHFETDACIALFGHESADWNAARRKEALKKATKYGNVPPVPGSRNIRDNINDLRAQVAANNYGVKLLKRLLEQSGAYMVQRYMKYLQQASADAVREVLRDAYEKLMEFKPVTHNIGTDNRENRSSEVFSVTDSMDDGSNINLSLTINHSTGRALFDFTGSSPQVYGNLNTPVAVTKSAIIYSLRCLVNREIPLNHGCMDPVDIILPKNSFLNPTPVLHRSPIYKIYRKFCGSLQDAAVVAGNVLTSQRITDIILKAFRVGADSYGCMNNVTFGGSKMSFYETIGGGCGAGPSWHGCSAIQCHMTNTQITDTEVFERRYPVLLTTFRIRKGSGGKGIYCGGDGIHREYMFLEDGISVNLLTERRSLAPCGMNFGSDGERGMNLWLVRQRSTSEELKHSTQNMYSLPWESTALSKNLETSENYRMLNVGAKTLFIANAGDRVVILTPGGGGYGSSLRSALK